MKQIEGSKSPYKSSWWEQFCALLWRSWLSVIKEPLLLKVRILQTVMTALTLGVIYFGQRGEKGYDQQSVQNVNGALFLLLCNITVSKLHAVLPVIILDK